MKNNLFKRTVALGVAAVVLGSSLAVAAISGSPYEVLKRSLLDAAKLQNGYIQSEMSLKMDDEYFSREMNTLSFVNGQFELNQTNSSGDAYEEDYARVEYSTADGHLSMGADYGSYWLYGYEYDVGATTGFSDLTEGDGRYIRLAELLVDLAVGDLKNNIAMTQTGEMRTISGTLTAAQVPELYNALLDVSLSEMGGGYAPLETVFERSSFDEEEMTIGRVERYISGSDYVVETQVVHLVPVDESYPQETIESGIAYGNMIYLNGNCYEIDEYREWESDRSPMTEAQYQKVADKLVFAPVQSAHITYLHGEADIDSDGVLRTLDATACLEYVDLFGGTHEVEFNLSFAYEEWDNQVDVDYYEDIIAQAETYLPNDESGRRHTSVYFDVDSRGRASNFSNDYAIYDHPYTFEVELPIVTVDGTTEYTTDENEWLDLRVEALMEDLRYEGLSIESLYIIAQNELAARLNEVEADPVRSDDRQDDVRAAEEEKDAQEEPVLPQEDDTPADDTAADDDQTQPDDVADQPADHTADENGDADEV